MLGEDLRGKKTYMNMTKCRSLCRPTHWLIPTFVSEVQPRVETVQDLGRRTLSWMRVKNMAADVYTYRTVMIIFQYTSVTYPTMVRPLHQKKHQILSRLTKSRQTYFWFGLPTLAALRHFRMRDVHLWWPSYTSSQSSLCPPPPKHTRARLLWWIFNKPRRHSAHVEVVHKEIQCD